MLRQCLQAFRWEATQWLRKNTVAVFPLRKDCRGYSLGKAGADCRAGLNVALLAFPQGMAYAMIAGLPIEYGIYASALAACIGALFAGSHFVTFGPTNATAVLVFTAFIGIGASEMDKIAMLPLLLLP